MHTFDDDLSLVRKPAREAATRADGPLAVGGRISGAEGVLRLQRAVGNAGVAQLMEGDEDRRSIDRAVQSGGSPLDAANRVQMESAMGADFSSVRVHTGSEADASARHLGAHAYTVGEDVVFANGRYNPGSTDGQRTLAHELTHVVQQRSGPVEGTDTGGGVKVSHPSDQYEQAAVASAERVVASRSAESTAPASAAPASSVQRAADDEVADVQRMEVQELAVQRASDEKGAEGPEEEAEAVQELAVQREGGEEEEADE